MKDVQLCGLGNALVDLQYRVDDLFLAKNGFKKSEMILVDSAKQGDVISQLSGLGNMCSGGSAANSIIAFSQLGGKAAYMTLLGADPNGEFYAKEFREFNIELHDTISHEEPTGISLVLITDDAERTMLTSLGASALFGISDINEELIARSEWLYIEGYKFSQESSTLAVNRAIKIAKQYNTKVSVTFSDVFITDLFKDNLEFAVKNADLVFCNENEAMSYTNTQEVESAIKELKNIVPNFVVTLGNSGSFIKWNDEEIKMPAYIVKAVDTTGAGDMFAGALFYGLLNGLTLEESGHLASKASSEIVSQLGARLNKDLVSLKENLLQELNG